MVLMRGSLSRPFRLAKRCPGQRPIQGGSYVVKRGDTLYSIAFNSGNDVPSLASLNNISPPYNIYPGQRLRLDGSSASVGSSRSAGTYEVRRGDTLSSIGRQFGMTPQALAQSNNLSAPMRCNRVRCSMSRPQAAVRPRWWLRLVRQP